MSETQKITMDQATAVATQLRLDFEKESFKLDQFCKGMNVELEHGTRELFTNVTDDDHLITGKIALAHLREFPDYYERLEKLEKEADAYWHKA